MKKKLLFIAIIFQILILISLVLYAYIPFFYGKEIQVVARGYDPRDIFLGNYVSLRYDFNEISENKTFKMNEKVYVVLKEHNGIYSLKNNSITNKKPKNEVFLAGNVRNTYQNKIHIYFGVEKYYTTKENAIKLQKELRKNKAIVTLSVLNGIARIKNIRINK